MTGLPAASPGHQGGLLSQYPFFGLFSSTSCFQVRAKVKALRMCSPDFTTRHAGGAVLFSRTRLYSVYFPHLPALIFISLAQAFTAINTVLKLVFFFMQLFIKCLFISVTGAPVELEFYNGQTCFNFRVLPPSPTHPPPAQVTEKIQTSVLHNVSS